MSSHIRKNEKGIALLFTLGILAVLLVIALAFATSSITERKAAANNAEVTSARLFAESAVQRAIAGLRYSDALTPTAAYDKMFSHCPAGTDPTYPLNNMTFDTLWRLATIKDYVTYYTWPTDYNPANANAVHWQYIHDTSDANNKILGRITYFVTASGGKLDPSMCVSHEKDVTTPTTDANGMTLDAPAGVSYPRGTADDESTVTEERNGKYVCEINIKNLDNNASGYLGATTIKNMSTTIGTGLLPDRTRWTDFDTFVNAFVAPALSNNQKSKFKDWFIVSPSSRDEERFWIDGGSGIVANDNNGLQDTTGTGEWYNRFNLARTDWGTNLALQGAAGVATLTGAPAPYVAGIFSDGTSIPWISKFGKKAIDGTDDNTVSSASNPSAIPYYGTFANVAYRRNQIAANIIDYFDANNAATTDSTTSPTYTGNDESPYINEIRLEIEGNVSEAGLLPTVYTCTIGVKAIDLEVVNIYGTAHTSNMNAEVTVSGEYNWNPKGGAVITFTDKVINVPITANVAARSYKSGTSLAVVDISPTVAPTTFSNNNPFLARSISNFKITKLNIKLTDTPSPTYGGFYDYSYVETDSDTHTITANGNTASLFFDYAVNDPRQNLNEGDWGSPATDIALNGTIGIINTNCIPNPGGNKDIETGAVEPWDVSTAYIRNAPAVSPWDIGIIHRGAQWETINLKKYNKDDNNDGTEASTEFGVPFNMGGRAYEKGDANILDQIKMTHDTNQGYGKINIRASTLDSLRALIGFIKYGSTLANPGTTGPNILDYSNTHLNNIANAINGSDKKPFVTRASIANVPVLTDGTEITQDKDALKEEIIGKFINLTKASIADEFTIIAIAQTIKDIGGIDPATITIKKDINGDGDVLDTNLDGTSADPGYFWNGTAKTYAATVPSPSLVNESINCKIGQYDLGADEILAEQKILCVIKKSSTGKWEIVRYEYIE